MIKLIIEDNGECTCQVEGPALDVASEISIGISKLLEPVPEELRKAILTLVIMKLR